jgi:hypothetical protein
LNEKDGHNDVIANGIVGGGMLVLKRLTIIVFPVIRVANDL